MQTNVQDILPLWLDPKVLLPKLHFKAKFVLNLVITLHIKQCYTLQLLHADKIIQIQSALVKFIRVLNKKKKNIDDLKTYVLSQW